MCNKLAVIFFLEVVTSTIEHTHWIQGEDTFNFAPVELHHIWRKTSQSPHLYIAGQQKMAICNIIQSRSTKSKKQYTFNTEQGVICSDTF